MAVGRMTGDYRYTRLVLSTTLDISDDEATKAEAAKLLAEITT